MGYGNNFGSFGNALLDLFTFGGHSRERERQKQEELNKLQMEREDNAYQRTVEDMNRAGLNPLTMSGTNNAQPLTNPIKSENTTFDKAIQLGTTIASVATGLAQAKNLNASTAGMGISNAMAQMDLDYLKGKGISPIQNAHKNQKELAELNKSVWGKIGDDIYEKSGEKINDLIERGTEIVDKGIKSVEKGEFVDNATEKIKEKGAERIENSGILGAPVIKYGEWKKAKEIQKYEEEMKEAQKGIKKWEKEYASEEKYRKLDEYKKMYKQAEEKLKKTKEKPWRDFI